MKKPTKENTLEGYEAEVQFAQHHSLPVNFLGSNSISVAILQQEARGQQEFVTSESLPSEINGSVQQTKTTPWRKQTEEDFAKSGIKLGPVYTEDPLFQSAELPQGWSKKGTEHSMHSDVIDDKGRIRIHVFYKAAFYDRSAHMSLINRFSVGSGRTLRCMHPDFSNVDSIPKDGDEDIVVIDNGQGPIPTERFRIKVGVPPEGSEPHQQYLNLQAARVSAAQWLDENYPDWALPYAYWDEDEKI